MANNYRVSGKKLTSRFGVSNKQARQHYKHEAEYYKDNPQEKSGGSRYPMPKRLAKKCKHTRWVDESYGGPESGCMAGYCKDCGYSFHHTLY